MKTKLPSINYALLAAAHEELKGARDALYARGGSADSVDDARVLGLSAGACHAAADGIFDVLNTLSNHADSAGAADAIGTVAA
jgi:hypothetical protein